MRIAIFLPSLNGGGTERVILTLADAFIQKGYFVDLVLASVQGEYVADIPPGLKIVDLKRNGVAKALFPLICYLRREHPNVIFSAMTHANVIAILAVSLANVQSRIVISERTTISEEFFKRKVNFKSRILRRVFPLLYRRANSIIAVSRGAAADLIHTANLPSSLVKVIYNPFDLKKIQYLASENLEHNWFLPGQPPVILAIGRLNHAKDYPTLIRAFIKIKSHREARLMILGEGELRKSLEIQIAEAGLTIDDIQMLGFLSNPFQYLSRCDVFVLSSRYEGLPGVLIEAMACGATVVSTACNSGPEEILEGGKWGQLVPVGDEAALADAILCILNNPSHLSPDGRIRAKDFGINQAVDAYLEAFGLLGKDRGS